MRFRRAARRHLCAFMAGVFLLMQGLVMAHACASVAAAAVQPGPARTEAGTAPGLAAHCHEGHAGAPSGAMGEEAPTEALLCKAHCLDEQQVPAAAGAADLAALALGWCLWLDTAAGPQAGALAAPAARPPSAAPPGWPPLYLALQVLRN